MTPKKRPQRFPLRVIKGGFAPADNGTADKLRSRGVRVGDLVFAEIKKPRNPGFWRLSHRLGTLAVENIEAFHGMDSHKVLKRLQLEANIGCEEVAYHIPGYGMVTQRIPLRLSYESMDEGEFREVYRGMCRHLAQTYWPGLDEDEIASMAEVMAGE